VRRLVLSFFGIGLVPGLPGTYGSAATAGLCWLAAERGVPLWVAAVAAVVVGTLATWLAATASETGPDGDPGWVVTDEVAGQGLAVLGAVRASSTLAAIGVSFVLFRVLDMWKPGPIRRLERLPGATGVLADDLLAGAVAGLATSFVPL
jgi:phosphatidylglycerophosphatase A